jgi:hypothetical protein
MAEWRNGEMAECRNGRMAEWRNGGMAEWRNGGVAEWWNGGMAEWRNGGMAEWRMEGQIAEWPEWQNGRMAGMAAKQSTLTRNNLPHFGRTEMRICDHSVRDSLTEVSRQCENYLPYIIYRIVLNFVNIKCFARCLH